MDVVVLPYALQVMRNIVAGVTYSTGCAKGRMVLAFTNMGISVSGMLMVYVLPPSYFSPVLKSYHSSSGKYTLRVKALSMKGAHKMPSPIMYSSSMRQTFLSFG